MISLSQQFFVPNTRTKEIYTIPGICADTGTIILVLRYTHGPIRSVHAVAFSGAPLLSDLRNTPPRLVEVKAPRPSLHAKPEELLAEALPVGQADVQSSGGERPGNAAVSDIEATEIDGTRDGTSRRGEKAMRTS